MADNGSGFGKILLWVVLAVVGVILVGNLIGWLIGALWNLFVATLLIAGIAVVAIVAVGAVRRSLSRGGRRQLPR